MHDLQDVLLMIVYMPSLQAASEKEVAFNKRSAHALDSTAVMYLKELQEQIEGTLFDLFALVSLTIITLVMIYLLDGDDDFTDVYHIYEQAQYLYIIIYFNSIHLSQTYIKSYLVENSIVNPKQSFYVNYMLEITNWITNHS